MKKIIIAMSIFLSTSISALASTGATLTVQAEHILWTELANENVATKYHSEVRCLAENIYFEARAESFSGKAAVANVTRNRVNDSRWPSTYCAVVMEGPIKESWKTRGKDVPDSERVYWPRKHKCQFSWYCDGLSDDPKDKKAYQKALDFATLIMHNDIQFVDITDGATHYHADYVKPDWAKTKTRTTEIGDHIFYRWEKK